MVRFFLIISSFSWLEYIERRIIGMSIAKRRSLSLLLVLALVIATLFSATPVFADPADPEDLALALDPSSATTINVKVDGQDLAVTKYVVTYVANPIDIAGNADPNAWQKMAIYVPATADASSAIIMQVNNSGWMPSPLNQNAVANDANLNSATSNTGAAFAAGYVVVSVGTRSRGLVSLNDANYYPGKAPAVVVDAKAAVRYLRLNDAVLPGSAERIVITGTSGGGGLSTAVAASGNAPEYFSYLKEIGAAGIDASGNSTINDDVFGTIAYCPITDLNNADLAYEWTYNGTRQINPATTYTSGYSTANLTALGLTAPTKEEMLAVSADLKAAYTPYLASLGLKTADGTAVTTDNLAALIQAEVIREAEETFAEGRGSEIPAYGDNFTFAGGGPGGGSGQSYLNNWISLNSAGKVTFFNYDNFLEFVAKTATLKAPPAFDGYATSFWTGQNETNLYGATNIAYSNVSDWAWNNNAVPNDGVGTDETGLDFQQYLQTPEGQALALQAKMVNPIPYLISSDGKSAPYWYVRHGVRDRDTSFAVELELKYAIEGDATIKDANFELAWIQPHSGNYDVPEAYAWLADVLAAEEVSATKASLDGPAVVQVGDIVEYTVGTENAGSANSALFTFDYSANLEYAGYRVPSGSFIVPIEGTALGKAFQVGSTSPLTAAPLTLKFKALSVGPASVSLTGAALATPTAVLEVVVAGGSVDTEIQAVSYLPYDFNRDGVVNDADLATAFTYYQVRVGDAEWEFVAERGIDLNGNGAVDLGDYILFLNR
jgi:hypothetical protein